MKTYLLKFIIITIFGICLVKQVHPQTPASDSSLHPYYINYWITGGIIAVGSVTNYLAVDRITHRPEITQTELNGLNKDILNGFDKWALEQDASKSGYYSNFSDNLAGVITVLPALLLFDKSVRHDWFDMLLMYLETMSITNNIYEYSFLGPTFQGRLRPKVYYVELPMNQRINGANRNSFYSGHTASATAATFFIAKVFTDYHPEIGVYKYLLYAAASIPPLILGYMRVKSLHHFPSDIMVGFGVGAVCGILIPEFHRLKDKNITLGLYSNNDALGITLNWQTNILK